MDPITLALQLALTTADWRQTRDISQRPAQYRELNPIMPTHPQAAQVNRYFILSEAAILGTAYALPKYEYAIMGTSIAMEGFIVWHNKQIGLSIGWAL